jgi:hypothetical protein
MTNSLTNVIPQLLAQGLLALRENSIMPRLVNSDYDTLGSEKGSAITIPIPSAVTVQDVSPAATPATNTQVSPTKATITLDNWKEAAFTLSDKEHMEVMSGTLPMQASEAIKSLANQVDQDILATYKGIYGMSGTPGTTPFGSSTKDATDQRVILNNQLAPLDNRRMVLNADAEGNALGLRAFQDMSFSGGNEGIIEGLIKRKIGFNWFMDQNVPSHTVGTNDGAYVINYATHAIGDSSVPIGTGTGTIVVGDIFTVAGDTQTYTCTALLSAAGTLSYSPTAKVAWADTAALTVKGTASTAYPQNLAFHRDAIAFVNRPLIDNTDGLGNLIVAGYDEISGLTIRLEVSREHKRTRYSWDILYGTQLVRADLASRLYG